MKMLCLYLYPGTVQTELFLLLLPPLPSSLFLFLFCLASFPLLLLSSPLFFLSLLLSPFSLFFHHVDSGYWTQITRLVYCTATILSSEPPCQSSKEIHWKSPANGWVSGFSLNPLVSLVWMYAATMGQIYPCPKLVTLQEHFENLIPDLYVFS